MEDTFRILHLSDLHVGAIRGNPVKLIEYLTKLKERRVDVVIFTGDIFDTPPTKSKEEDTNHEGQKVNEIEKEKSGENKKEVEEKKEIDEDKKRELIKEAVSFFNLLRELLNSGKSNLKKEDFLFVAGNHDLYQQPECDTWSLYNDFLDSFYKESQPDYLYRNERMFIKAYSNRKKLLLGFDSNIDDKSEEEQFVGHITDKQLKAADEYLKLHYSHYLEYDKIAFFHHPCNFFEEQNLRNTDGIMNNSMDVTNKLAEWNVKLILHGHKHWARQSIIRPVVGQEMYMFAAGSIDRLRDESSANLIKMGKEIYLEKVVSREKDEFELKTITISDNYMSGLLPKAIESWDSLPDNEKEKQILKLINKLYLSYEQLSLLQYNHGNLFVLQNSIRFKIDSDQYEESSEDITIDVWNKLNHYRLKPVGSLCC